MGPAPYKQVVSAAGTDAMKASTSAIIFVKTLNEPLEACCKTVPIKVIMLAAVVGSKHPQIRVGDWRPA